MKQVVRVPFIVAALMLSALVLSSCNFFNRGDNNLPLPILEYIPDQLRLLPDDRSNLNELQEINIDNDEQPEWLLFFYYDNVLPDGPNGPIGGLIYDAQQNTELYNPEVVIPFPFQPTAFLVPYRLLPDWTPGKGQGYLGDTGVSYVQTTIDEDKGWADELVVSGYGAGSVRTRLSIFFWQGVTKGYGVAHFTGSYNVNTDQQDGTGPVRQVTTLNRLDDRSNLCRRNVFNRQGDSPVFSASPSTIVFCQGGPPQQPAYPDAVVLSYMLGGPTALIFEGRQFQVEQVFDRSRLQQVVRLSYTGAAATTGTGNTALRSELVTTEVDMSTGREIYEWRLEEQKPKLPDETSEWLIVDVQRKP